MSGGWVCLIALRSDLGHTQIYTLVHSCCESLCVFSTQKKILHAAASFEDTTDFACYILLALVLLGEAKGSEKLDLK